MVKAKIVARGGVDDISPNQPHYKILIIEDNEDLLQIIGDSFESKGHKTIKTPFGKKGVELAKQEKPDAIILDILLDDIDGFEVLSALREDPETHITPIIVYTNLQSTTDKMAGIRLGADAFYQKTELPPLQLVEKTSALLAS